MSELVSYLSFFPCSPRDDSFVRKKVTRTSEKESVSSQSANSLATLPLSLIACHLFNQSLLVSPPFTPVCSFAPPARKGSDSHVGHLSHVVLDGVGKRLQLDVAVGGQLDEEVVVHEVARHGRHAKVDAGGEVYVLDLLSSSVLTSTTSVGKKKKNNPPRNTSPNRRCLEVSESPRRFGPDR